MSEAVIKVGFLNYFSQYWMGGVTYFKNLFQAMRTVRDPVLKPYILKPAESCADTLLEIADVLEKDEIPWSDPDRLPTAQDYGMDVISHLQECKAVEGIAWIADFQHKHLPEMFSAEEIASRDKTFSFLAKTNRIVVLSSDDALRDFSAYYPEYAHKGRRLHFVSIPEPGSLPDLDAHSTCARLGIPERFFYVPNQFWKHKNHIVVLKAVSRLKKRGIGVTVVCSGKTVDSRFPGYFDELMAYCKAEGIEENVKVVGLIDRKDVYFLLRQCVALVNPSRFEGWSSSVEEAKSIGKTIILSNLPVHFEQNPPQGRFFPVDDDERLASIMENAWAELPSGPDAELEKLARDRLPARIRAFGEEFKKIVLEAQGGGCDSGCCSTGKAPPAVTVVTVVRNAIQAGRLEELRQNIRSVSGQTCVAVEHLIVDGASTDGTTDELRRLAAADDGIVLISEPDAGIYDAMNKGVVNARGRYVAFLNSDDFYCDMGGLALSVKKLDETNADFSFSPVNMVDGNGQAVVHCHVHPTMAGICSEMVFSHQSMLVRREVLLEMALFDTRYRSSADYDLVLRMIIAGKKGVLTDCRFSTFRLGGFSQENMRRSQQEVGDIYFRLYSGHEPGFTPERGYDLYIRKQPSPRLAAWFGELEDSARSLSAPIAPVTPVPNVELNKTIQPGGWKKWLRYINGGKSCKMDVPTIRVGFESSQSVGWLGGINYYRNLFIAVNSLKEGPRIVPCAPRFSDEAASVLAPYVEYVDLPAKLPSLLQRIFKKINVLTGKDQFNPAKWAWRRTKVDVMSHTFEFTGKPTLTWIPDFQHIHYPDNFSAEDVKARNTGYRYVAHKCDLMILSSQDAVGDFKVFCPEMAHKARCLRFVAMPEAGVFGDYDEMMASLRNKFGIPDAYFYLPNQFWKHKNHRCVFEAVKLLKDRGVRVDIVCTGYEDDVGTSGYCSSLHKYCADSGIDDRVRFLGLVEHGEVHRLMRGSLAVINPSFFEGWSTSVEEVKSIGKEIVLSDIAVHREQNPPCAHFFSPYSAEELANILQTVRETKRPGPDSDLEAAAAAALPERIREFGETYRSIVLEVMNLKKH